MKKEKKVRTYQRRTKSGKLVTVKAHTAKYDAAEKAKELAKKKGAGDELAERKKSAAQLEIPFDKDDEKKVIEEVKEVTKKDSEKTTKKSKSSETKSKKSATPKEEKSKATPKSKEAKIKESKPTTSEPAFTAAEFKEWYRGTGSAADKKVAKALRAQLGRAGYRKLEDEAIDNYSVRGHSAMFKRVSTPTSESKPSKETAKTSDGKTEFSEKELNAYGRRLYHAQNHYVGGPGPKSYQAALRKRKEALEEYHKTDEGKAMKAAYAKYLADMSKADRKRMLEAAKERKISEARKIVAEADKKSTPKSKPTMVRVGTDPKRVEEVKNQRDEQAKRDKAFLALPKPDKGSKGYATHMALRSFVRQGGFGDDSMRDALVRHGYPKDTAYSKGIKEVIALGRKHGVIPEPKSSKQKAKMSKSSGVAPKAEKSSSEKVFRGLSSENIKTRDDAVTRVLAANLPKLRTLPKGMAKHYEYSYGGDVSTHSRGVSNAQKVLERVPDKLYNKLYKQWDKRQNEWKKQEVERKKREREQRKQQDAERSRIERYRERHGL